MNTNKDPHICGHYCHQTTRMAPNPPKKKKALHFGYAVDYLHFVITGITVVVVAVPEVKRRCKLTLTLESPLLSNFDCEKS